MSYLILALRLRRLGPGQDRRALARALHVDGRARDERAERRLELRRRLVGRRALEEVEHAGDFALLERLRVDRRGRRLAIDDNPARAEATPSLCRGRDIVLFVEAEKTM